ncbi:DUF309 domain-containing protein [Rhodococcus sp. NPDC059234]|uniref:DUF309 domain-containing protein n=1 Tax=Rhodococcus sp. NPDC059234 TaxID=3346781 RepID=UPI00366F1DCC
MDGRERDVRGRPLNARPRDGLGRPLPRGSVGVPRISEGQVRTPGESVAEAQRLFDEGMPFHAHEVLEDAWKSAPESERALWQGLAQLAVGLTHLLRGNAVGARALLVRGRERIAAYATDVPYGLDVPGLLGWSGGVIEGIDAGAGSTDVSMPRLRA